MEGLLTMGLLAGGFVSFWFLVFILWSIVWKGWALWIAARKGSKPWFIALLLLNTAGILEILYIFVFSKKIEQEKSSEKVHDAEEVKTESTDQTSNN